MSKHPISGVAPAELGESTVMIVWPSVALYPLGRALGRLYAIQWPHLYIFRLGNLLALLASPLAVVLYFLRVLPGIGIRYHLTNRRIVIQRGLANIDASSIGLGEFQTVLIEVLPGQEWYDAGDLVFRRDSAEVFRLPGVSRPAAFREICQKSQTAHQGVQRALRAERETAAAT